MNTPCSQSQSLCGAKARTLHQTMLAFLIVALTILIPAQTQAQTMMPLPAYGSTYTSTQIRGYWFQAPTEFIIVGLRVPTDIGTTPQNIQIVRLTAPPPVYSASTTAHTTLGLWTNVNTTTMIPCFIPIQAGDYIAIFGTRTNGTSMNNSYATPAGQYTSSILGYPVTLTRMVYQAGSFPVAAISQEVGGSIARTEMYYIPPITGPNDAGIVSVDSPLNYCAGTHPVTVTLRNYGTNQLTSATINWSINSVLQTPVSWTGLLDTTNQTTRSTQVTLGSRDFLSNVSYTIRTWPTLPNGVPDTVSRNDTAEVTGKAALSGVFTIGGGGANFPTISAAAAELTNNGICGPVVFKIRNGTYNEQVELTDIPGASVINTVTFESESGNRTDVNITYNSTGTAANYVVNFSGCDYVTFRNVTMTATNATYATCVLVQSGAENCTVNNCVLTGSASATTSTYSSVIYSPSGSLDHNLTISNNLIQNGSYAMYLYGSGTASLEQNLLVENNTITNFAYMGIYGYYQDSPRYLNNTITSSNTNYNYKYPTYLYYNYNALRYMGNTVNITGPIYNYGVLVYYSVGTSTNYGIIANNFMTFNNGNTYYAYGLRTGYGSYTKVMFNTIYINSLSTYYAMYHVGGNDYTYTNNIAIYNGPGYAFYSATNPSPITTSDYNVLYTNGSYLAYWNGGTRADLAALQAASGKDQNSITKVPEFSSIFTGDLHLTGVSEDDPALVGAMEPDVAFDIDGEPRILPYRGADEACYITKGSVWFELTDAGGTPAPYANVPGTMGVHYHVEFPEFDANINITLNFYTVPGNVLTYTTSFQVAKQYGVTLDGLQLLNLTGIPTGIYRVEAVFNTKNSCGGYRNFTPPNASFMLLPTGQQPCIVWPGDVNNDGLVNFGDRKSLNTYIQDANLSPIWLTGPARYRADGAQNPLTFLTWEAQAAVPWQTPEGCYMDADGNGTVNSFDYIGIKMNWMRDHVVSGPKLGNSVATLSYDLKQNYPNPFNPSTQIQFTVPEQSHVRIAVYDANGREVVNLYNSEAAEGTHTVSFDTAGLNLSSGLYTAVATMQGVQTNISVTKTILMTLSK